MCFGVPALSMGGQWQDMQSIRDADRQVDLRKVWSDLV
jgi:hypothetical protein